MIYATYMTASPPECGGIDAPNPVEFVSLSRPTLDADPGFVKNGRKVKFTGELRGPFFNGFPTIALQVRLNKKWRTFKAVPVGRDGKFSGVYRFTNTTGTTGYKFRAKPLTAGTVYPYSVLNSKTQKVLVRP